VKFRDWAEYVQPECPGCPLFQVDKAVREAAISLLSRADLYRAEPELISILPGVTEYDLEAPTGAEPNRVLDLTHNGRSLTKVADEATIYSMLDAGQPSTPTHYYQRDNEAIIIAPAPKEQLQFRLFLALKPSATSTSIPDGIAREYRDLIAAGAKARLMLMAAQTWTSPELGGYNRQLFERGVSAAIRRVTFGFNGAPLTVKKRDFM
jgi:hypothetical protein